MQRILPVVLLLLPALYAGEYFELHRDAYEVILNSDNFTQKEKQAFQMQYEKLILKDELLMALRKNPAQQGNNDKVAAIEQLVGKINHKRNQQYLFLSDMRKENNDDVFSLLCLELLFVFSSAEKMDFESYLSKIRNWDSEKKRGLYFNIMRHTTVYQLDITQERNDVINFALENNMQHSIKEVGTDDYDDKVPKIEY